MSTEDTTKKMPENSVNIEDKPVVLDETKTNIETPIIDPAPVNTTTPSDVSAPETVIKTPPSSPHESFQSPGSTSGNKGMIAMVGGLFVLVLMLLGGVYYYLNNQNANTAVPAKTAQTPTATPMPKMEASESGTLIEQAENLDLGDVDKEFTNVDPDIKKL